MAGPGRSARDRSGRNAADRATAVHSAGPCGRADAKLPAVHPDAEPAARISRFLSVVPGAAAPAESGAVTQTEIVPARTDAPPATWLDGGALADGTGRDPVPNPGILAERGRITSIGGSRPADAAVVDCTGLRLVPGRVDRLRHT